MSWSDVLSIPSNLVSNGKFTANTTGWSIYVVGSCTLASVAGGREGNCLEITRVAGSQQNAYQDITVEAGKRYRATVWVKSGTSGNEVAKLQAATVVIDVTVIEEDSLTTSSEWQKLSVDFTVPAGYTTIRLLLKKNTATVGTMLFDDVELYLIGNWSDI